MQIDRSPLHVAAFAFRATCDASNSCSWCVCTRVYLCAWMYVRNRCVDLQGHQNLLCI